MEQNSADYGRWPLPAIHLGDTNWLSGPLFLGKDDGAATLHPKFFELVEIDLDADIWPPIVNFATKVSETLLGSDRFYHFSIWKLLTHGIARLNQKVRSHCRALEGDMAKADELMWGGTVISWTVQHEVFTEELDTLSKWEIVSKQSPLRKLDKDDVVRVEGHISAAIPWKEKHPIIIPKKNITLLHCCYSFIMNKWYFRGGMLPEGAIGPLVWRKKTGIEHHTQVHHL